MFLCRLRENETVTRKAHIHVALYYYRDIGLTNLIDLNYVTLFLRLAVGGAMLIAMLLWFIYFGMSREMAPIKSSDGLSI